MALKIMRASVLKFAQEQAEARRAQGFLAAISPSPVSLIDEVLSDVDDDQHLLIDMGCGDGRWLVRAARRFQNCMCIGVEMDDERICRTTASIIAEDVKVRRKIELVRSNFLHVHISAASLIIVYLSRDGNEALRQKFDRECAKGTTIIAVGFQMAWLSPERTYTSSPPAYRYVIR